MNAGTLIVEKTLAPPFVGFSAKDFDLFAVEGLEPRMAELKEHLRPKLTVIGEQMAPVLSVALGREMYPHVAKHARRKTNPPNDSWVAFSEDPRGYKKWPTFMVGLWYTHLFVQFGVIYESPIKGRFGDAMLHFYDQIRAILPMSYEVFPDHTKPDGIPLSNVSSEQFADLIDNLTKKRQADLLFGLRISREEVLSMSSSDSMNRILDAGGKLAKLYSIAKGDFA